MALYLLVSDYGLRKDHGDDYERFGRWALAAAVLLGWTTGRFTAINEAAIAALFAFLAGGTIMNVIKEELPEERASSFWAFAFGALVYVVLLLAQ